MNVKRRLNGFSMIEMIAVIILLGIIAVVVLPKFSSRDGFSEYALRDQLISSFRFAQQRAMYDHGADCYRLNIDVSGFGSQRSGNYISEPVGKISFTGDYNGFSIDPAIPVYFDGLGNTYIGNAVDCGDSPLADPAIFTVQPSGIQFQIFSTGYIKAL